MNVHVRLALLVLAMAATGCQYPTTRISTTEDRPLIGIRNAPAGSVLWVDGAKVGAATDYDGTQRALSVRSGTHHIRVLAADGAVLLDTPVFVADGEYRQLVVVGARR